MGDQSLALHLRRAAIAWQEFVATGCVQSGAVQPLVLESWERCRAMGMDPHQTTGGVVLPADELRGCISRKRELLDLALPILHEVHEVVRGSGFIVVMTDENGVILEAFGDPEMVEAGKQGKLFPGSIWREDTVGTSAIGLALSSGLPIQVAGAEHYFACDHDLTCSAAPVLDPDGRLTGVIDVSAHCDQVHPHTLGMVVGAARAIQYGLRIWKDAQSIKLANQFLQATQESISDGLIVLDAGGCIAGINGQAARILGLVPELVRGKPVSAVLHGLASLLQVLELNRPLVDAELSWDTPHRRVSVHVNAHPIRDDGSVLGVVAIINESRRLHRLVSQIAGTQARFRFADIIGESDAIRQAVKTAMVAARSRSTVLIEGESGTGKELFAQAIHSGSDPAAPFVAVNCAAIPATLIESELFGYEGGAFTGASPGGRPGKFELASGGTLFLDEIALMPLTLQAVLLRALQERGVVRVGGQRFIPVHVRVIAASNRDLATEVRQGNFREDLYYRLNVMKISVPPLRSRPSDIPLLVDSFVKQIGQQCGKTVNGVEPAVMEVLQRYRWPGNVRQLQNVIERAVNFAQGEYLTMDTLPDYLFEAPLAAGARGSGRRSRGAGDTGLKPWERAEQEHLRMVIDRFDGNLVRAARALDIGRSTLYRKLKRFGWTPGEVRNPRGP